MIPRRVVVTGVGLVTPLGCGVERVWHRLINGRSGISRLRGMEEYSFPSQVAAYVPTGDGEGDYRTEDALTTADTCYTAQSVHFAAHATKQALAMSGWKPDTDEEKDMTGVVIGTGMVDLATISDTSAHFHNNAPKAYRKISPFFVPKVLVNSAAGFISIQHSFRGPNHACSTACATGGHAIGDAFRFIKDSMADVIVAGGADSCIHPLSVGGFSKCRALSKKSNDDPEKASRPFDRDRDGFVIGEGSGIVVLEEREHALRRGAPILAEIVGYGLSGDASHITNSSGTGALRAMRMALKSASLQPHDIDYLNAHATSTPSGDGLEARATAEVLGSAADTVSVSSTKGATGHLLGGAGAVEAVFCVQAIREGVAPPTLNLHNPSEDLPALDLTPLEARARPVRVAMSNSFGFGGTNSALVFAAPS